MFKQGLEQIHVRMHKLLSKVLLYKKFTQYLVNETRPIFSISIFVLFSGKDNKIVYNKKSSLQRTYLELSSFFIVLSMDINKLIELCKNKKKLLPKRLKNIYIWNKFYENKC